MLSTHFVRIADEVGPAWHLWQFSRDEFEPLMPEVATMMASQDLIQVLKFRGQEKFIAFDMSCRRIRTLAFLATLSPENDVERTLRALTRTLYEQMNETAAFNAMRALSQHTQKLQALAPRTLEVFHLRLIQKTRQCNFSDQFHKQFTSAERIAHAR